MRLFSAESGALGLGAVLLVFSQAVSAIPFGLNETDLALPFYRPSQEGGHALFTKRADPRDFYLRIMPLGASIVKGDPGAPDDVNKENNGFRKALRDKLRFDGWKVNMVGSMSWGKMADNDHEAVPGQRIDQAHDRVRTSAPIWKPNVYLINCGTNDAAQNRVAGAGERMRSMIEAIFSYTPDATVILSTLLMHGQYQSRVEDINRQFRSLVSDMQGSDPRNPRARVFLAEMQDGFIQEPRDIWDGIHPNFEGFRKMAAVWAHAIDRVNELNWLQPPSGGRFPDGEAHTTCKKEFGSGGNHPNGAGVKVLFAGDSTIRDDGPYRHQSKSHGVYLEGKDFGVRTDTEMYWAQLVDFGAPREQALDELIRVDDSTDHMRVYVNRGGGRFDEARSFKVGHYCINRGIHWGDVNGDGLDDYICITPDGTPFVAINTSKLGQVVPTFGPIFKWRNPIGNYRQDRVRLGDIDGDGRLDYCVLHDNANIHCYRNGGLGNGAAYWQDMGSGGPVFLAKGMGDWRGVRFVDINGDGRSDWVWLDQNGQTTIWINKRGEDKGMVPFWQKADASHPGMGEPIGETRAQVKFGRIYGNSFADYSFFKKTNCLQTSCTGTVYTWENRAMDGGGGRWQKGDGARFGDLTGTGFDDYIWISAFGQLNIFLNKNRKDNFDWYKSIAWGGVIKYETGFNRRQLHIGDWNGDGKADIIGVNRATGELTIWYNNWDGRNFNWNKRTAGGTAGRCTQGWGVLYHDTAHHFADITGNGRVDYICIFPNGRMTAMLNLDGGNFADAGQIKYQEDLDRANYKFADVNGDGLSDILHIDKFTGDARVFYNQSPHRTPSENGGSSFSWARPDPAYRGSSRGPNMLYPSLSGQGRADMLEVNPNTAHAWVSFNTCPNGGDDSDVSDPRLPAYRPGNGGPGQEPGRHWFCDTVPAAWDTQLWGQYNMGEWLLDRTAYYSGFERNWPLTGRSDGVPRVIAEYEYENRDFAFNWPGPGCQSIAHNCDLSGSDLRTDECRTNWRRAFSLWGMRNFVLYLQSYHHTVLQAAVYASFDNSLLATNFLAVDNPSMNPSAWLTIAAGMVTSFAAAFSGPVGIGGNALAGLITAAAGISAGFEGSPPLDPRFDSFAQLEGKLGAIVAAVQGATANYFHRLVIERPPNNNMARGTEFARILQSGLMADQDFGTGETSVDVQAQRRLLRAPLLSEVWNGQDVFIVKFGSRQVNLDTVNFKYSPCFGDNQNVDDLGRHNACTGNANWMIGRWSNDPFKMFDEALGTAKAKLDLLGFNKELIVERAIQIQERTGTFRPRGMLHVEQRLRDMATSSQSRLDDALWFNIPVCDLTRLGDELEYGDDCYNNLDNPAFTLYCIKDVIRKNCPRVRLNGQEWPLK